MAKRGRPPKGKTIEDLNEPLRNDINLAIDSDADESPRSIFGRFGLSQREINFRTFRKYVGERRRERRDVPDETPISGTPSIEDIRDRCYAEILESLRAGDTKPYELASILARVQAADQIEIQRDAEKRAAEKHDAWKKEYRDRLAREKAAADAKLDRMASEKGITDEVRDGIKDLYGLKI